MKKKKFAKVNSIEKSEKIKLPQIETISGVYQPRRNGKGIRILTVAFYVLCVSLAAIMLSTYYIFIWDPTLKPYVAKSANYDKIIIPEQIAIRLLNSTEITANQFYQNMMRQYRIQQNYQRRSYYHNNRPIQMRNHKNYKKISSQKQRSRKLEKLQSKSPTLSSTTTTTTSSSSSSSSSSSFTYDISTTTTQATNLKNLNLEKPTKYLLTKNSRDDEDYDDSIEESSGITSLIKTNKY